MNWFCHWYPPLKTGNTSLTPNSTSIFQQLRDAQPLPLMCHRDITGFIKLLNSTEGASFLPPSAMQQWCVVLDTSSIFLISRDACWFSLPILLIFWATTLLLYYRGTQSSSQSPLEMTCGELLFSFAQLFEEVEHVFLYKWDSWDALFRGPQTWNV